jgi:hypothetical protein
VNFCLQQDLWFNALMEGGGVGGWCPLWANLHTGQEEVAKRRFTRSPRASKLNVQDEIIALSQSTLKMEAAYYTASVPSRP